MGSCQLREPINGLLSAMIERLLGVNFNEIVTFAKFQFRKF